MLPLYYGYMRGIAKRHFLFIFCLLFVAGFLVLPELAMGASESMDPLEAVKFEDKLKLKELDETVLIKSLVQKFNEKWQNADNLEEEATLALLQMGARKTFADYLFFSMPPAVGKIMFNVVYKIACLIITQDPSIIIEEIEKMTVSQAKDYVADWLFQNEIRVSSGNIKGLYRSYTNRKLLRNFIFPYIIAYRPVDNLTGKVAMEIYSSKTIDSPFPMVGLQWEGGISEISPFIVRINGEAKKVWVGAGFYYEWTRGPRIDVLFDEPVPDFTVKETGFIEGQINNFEEWVKETGMALDKIIAKLFDYFGKTGEKAGSAVGNVGSIFSKLNPLIANVSSESPIFSDSEANSLDINLASLLSELSNGNKGSGGSGGSGDGTGIEGAVNKTNNLFEGLEDAAQTAGQISAGDMREMLDDISEEIDVLTQEVAELAGELHGGPILLNQNGVGQVMVFSGNNGESEKGERGEAGEKGEIEKNGDGGDESVEQTGQGQILLASMQAASLSIGRGTSEIIVSYPKILISEVQIAGVERPKDEFVELFNPNSEEQDLTGWYLQKKTKSAENFSSFASNNLFSGKKIAGKGYFLIAREDSSFVYMADVLINGALAENNLLVLKNPNREIVDKVGWGEANDFETAPAGNTGAGQSLGREWSEADANYFDTDNNLNDFNVQNPTPKNRNSSQSIESQIPEPEISPIEKPEKDMIPPEVVFSLAETQNNFVFKVGWQITDRALETTTPSGMDGFSLRWKEGKKEEDGEWNEEYYQKVSGAPTNYSGGKEFTGKNNYIYYFQINAKDAADNESGWLPETPISTEIKLPEKVLINEIQIDSVEGNGGADDDWVELYNPGDSDIGLAGWSIQEHSADEPCSTGKSFYKKHFFEEAIIPSKGFFLIVDTEARDGLKNIANMEIAWSLTLGNTIYLVKNQEKIADGEDIDIIDKVGFGVACFAETNPALNPPSAKSIERKELGLDTNDNSADFQINESPSPINSKGETILAPVVLEPASPSQGGPVWQTFQGNNQRTGRASAVGIKSGTLREIADLGLFNQSRMMTVSQPLIRSDGVVLYGAGEVGEGGVGGWGKIYAFNHNGISKWESADLGSPIISLSMSADTNAIYFSSFSAGLIALDTESGAEKWRYYSDDIGMISGVAQDEAGNIYFTNYSSVDKFYSLKPDGTERWVKEGGPRGGSPFAGPAIGKDGFVYIIWQGSDSENGLLRRYSSDGELKWEERSDYSASGPTIGDDGNVYIVSGISGAFGTRRILYIFNSGDGSLMGQNYFDWGQMFNPVNFRDGFFAIADSWSVFGVEAGGIYYYYPRSDLKVFDSRGNIVWQTAIEENVSINSQPISDSEGNIFLVKTIYKQQQNGPGMVPDFYRIDILSPDDGHSVGSVSVSEGAFIGSLSISKDGYVYFALNFSDEGPMARLKLYSLEP